MPLPWDEEQHALHYGKTAPSNHQDAEIAGP